MIRIQILSISAPTTVQGATDGAPKMPESLEAAASKHESSTSISGEDKSKTQNLNSGTVYRLDKGQLISECPFLVSSFRTKYQ